MAGSTLSAPHFHNEDAAFAYVEAHLWPHGPVCFHCKGTERIGKMNGKTTRAGLYKCYACRKPFTVRMGSIFESSHVPLRVWLQIIYLMCSSKKGISTRQIHRIIGGSLKTAWFLGHRIREAMRSGELGPMGGTGATVEADETYIGRKEGVPVKRGYQHKRAVLSLVERGGEVRSFHVDKATVADVVPIVKDNIARESVLMTDESNLYTKVGRAFKDHDFVNHGAGEYVRDEVHTNTVEGYFSIFKRGFKGIYQHCGEQHLHRYLAEYDFRYNNRIRLGVDDLARSSNALKAFAGKRLTYQTTRGFQTARA
jgi:transposase-like protein